MENQDTNLGQSQDDVVKDSSTIPPIARRFIAGLTILIVIFSLPLLYGYGFAGGSMTDFGGIIFQILIYGSFCVFIFLSGIGLEEDDEKITPLIIASPILFILSIIVIFINNIVPLQGVFNSLFAILVILSIHSSILTRTNNSSSRILSGLVFIPILILLTMWLLSEVFSW